MNTPTVRNYSSYCHIKFTANRNSEICPFIFIVDDSGCCGERSADGFDSVDDILRTPRMTMKTIITHDNDSSTLAQIVTLDTRA